MKAIILAAGEGKRMLPLTITTPKPMLRVHDKPLLKYILESLPEEVDEYIIVVGYKKEIIQDYFGDSFNDKKITYLVQSEKTGTADALILCKELLEDNERFLLSYADDVFDKESIRKCLNYKHSILIAETPEPKRYGVVSLRDDSTILEIEEKPEFPKSNLVASGVYILDTSIFNYKPRSINGEYYFTTMLDQFIKDNKVFTEKVALWVTIGYPKDLELASDLLPNNIRH